MASRGRAVVALRKGESKKKSRARSARNITLRQKLRAHQNMLVDMTDVVSVAVSAGHPGFRSTGSDHSSISLGSVMHPQSLLVGMTGGEQDMQELRVVSRAIGRCRRIVWQSSGFFRPDEYVQEIVNADAQSNAVVVVDAIFLSLFWLNTDHENRPLALGTRDILGSASISTCSSNVAGRIGHLPAEGRIVSRLTLLLSSPGTVFRLELFGAHTLTRVQRRQPHRGHDQRTRCAVAPDIADSTNVCHLDSSPRRYANLMIVGYFAMRGDRSARVPECRDDQSSTALIVERWWRAEPDPGQGRRGGIRYRSNTLPIRLPSLSRSRRGFRRRPAPPAFRAAR